MSWWKNNKINLAPQSWGFFLYDIVPTELCLILDYNIFVLNDF